MDKNKLILSRRKGFDVFWTPQDSYLFKGFFVDEYHEFELEVEISFPELVVTRVGCNWIRPPYEDCRLALQALQAVPGLNVFGRGLKRRLEEAIGGAKGCTHITEMILDACILALFQANRGRLDKVVQIQGTEEVLVRKLIEERPWVLGSCIALSPGSILLEQAGIGKDGTLAQGELREAEGDV